MTALDLTVGERIKFAGDRYWWIVRAVDERFAVLTRFTPFRGDGLLTYTIADAERGRRGPCNLIGQGWDIDPAQPEAGASELLIALNGGIDTLDDHSLPDDERTFIPSVEISGRNNVAINITTRKAFS